MGSRRMFRSTALCQKPIRSIQLRAVAAVIHHIQKPRANLMRAPKMTKLTSQTNWKPIPTADLHLQRWKRLVCINKTKSTITIEAGIDRFYRKCNQILKCVLNGLVGVGWVNNWFVESAYLKFKILNRKLEWNGNAKIAAGLPKSKKASVNKLCQKISKPKSTWR